MIKTTRLRDSQVPQNKVYDLSPQCNGQRQYFQLPSRVFPVDRCYLILNGKTIRNDINHTFYTFSNDGTHMTTYFQTAPTGTDTLQFVKSDNSEGVEPFATEEYAEAVANLAKQAAIETAEGYTDTEIETLDTEIRTDLGADITAEATTRAAADTTLQNNLDTEGNTRSAADTNLQSQIDGIIARSDVVDIVGTYAELMSYVTTELGDKDVIKVLADETHSGAISYYRFAKATTTWSFIGSEGPYLTPSAAATTYTPLTRTINGHALSGDFSLTYSDVGAASPSDIPTKTSDLTNDGSDGTSTYVESDDLTTTLGNYYTKTQADATFATKQELADVTGDIGDILDAIHNGNIVIIEEED